MHLYSEDLSSYQKQSNYPNKTFNYHSKDKSRFRKNTITTESSFSLTESEEFCKEKLPNMILTHKSFKESKNSQLTDIPQLPQRKLSLDEVKSVTAQIRRVTK